MKVFHNSKLLVLAEEYVYSQDDFFGICIKNSNDLKSFVKRWLKLSECRDVMVHGYNLAELIEDFKSMFIFLEAAGGVVRNNDDKVLFIRRWDMWDLPKGKMEKGETPEQTALREVKEETGIKALNITGKLAESYHIYYDEPPYYLKRSHWFAMETNKTETLTPQLEEDITEVVWMDKQACNKAFSETYRTLREVLMEKVCDV